MNEWEHDQEPQPEWQCPCPECNGWVPDDDEPDPDAHLTEPSAAALEPSEWVWAE